MRNRKISLIFCLVMLAVILAVVLCGCELSPEDCKVFGEEEFAELRQEDNSSEEGAFRIMSSNVLVHIKGWGGEPVKPRAHRFAEAVKHYAPDVIGMQEMCSDWYKYLLPQLADYEVIHPKHSAFMENRSAILYNKSKLDLVDEGFQKYSVGDKNGCRAITYGVFKRKSDNKQIIVSSTHFDLIRNKDYEKEKGIMLKQTGEFLDVIKGLEEKYPNVPIAMTGDYNSMEHENSRFEGEVYDRENDLTYYRNYGTGCGAFAYQEIVKKYKDAKFVEGIERHFDNDHGYAYEDPTWDHIFLSNVEDSEVSKFAVLMTDYFLPDAQGKRVSDHLPIFVDLVIE